MSRSTSAIHLDVHPDMRILAFTALVSLVAVIVFGLIPAWRASRLDLSQAVKEGNRAATAALGRSRIDRKSTRLNSSHGYISYAVFCLKKKNKVNRIIHARVALVSHVFVRLQHQPLQSIQWQLAFKLHLSISDHLCCHDSSHDLVLPRD